MTAKFNGNYSVYDRIDWANDKHELCIYQANSGIRKFKLIKHLANTINEWIERWSCYRQKVSA
jgi:hypothetical protein